MYQVPDIDDSSLHRVSMTTSDTRSVFLLCLMELDYKPWYFYLNGSPDGCNPIGCPVPDGENGAHCQDTLRIDDDIDPQVHQFISRSIIEIFPGQRA